MWRKCLQTNCRLWSRSTVVEESLDEILKNRKTSFPIVQSAIQSVVYNFIEQVMLDLLLKDVIGDRLDPYKATFFDTETSGEGFSKRLLTLSSFMVPAYCKRFTHEPDTEMREMEYSTTCAPRELNYLVYKFPNDSERPPSRSNFRSYEELRGKLLKRPLSRWHSKQKIRKWINTRTLPHLQSGKTTSLWNRVLGWWSFVA